MPNSVISRMIAQSDAYIDSSTKRKFGLNTGEIEYLDVEPKQKVFFVKNYPIITCSEVAENISSQADTPDWKVRTEGLGNDYICNAYDRSIGRIRFIDNYPQQGIDRLRVTYNWGYNTTPEIIEELSTLMTIRRLVDSNLYRTIVKGKDAFSPIRLEQVDTRINDLLAQVNKSEFDII